MLNLEAILSEVSRFTGVTREDLLAKSRGVKRVAEARQLAMYLTWRLLPGESLTSLGQAFGRDRTTVRHALNKYMGISSPDIEDMEARLGHTTAAVHTGERLDTSLDVRSADKLGVRTCVD